MKSMSSASVAGALLAASKSCLDQGDAWVRSGSQVLVEFNDECVVEITVSLRTVVPALTDADVEAAAAEVAA